MDQPAPSGIPAPDDRPARPEDVTQLDTSDVPADFSSVMGANVHATWTSNPSVLGYRATQLFSANQDGTKLDKATALKKIKDEGLEGQLSTEDGEYTQKALDILIARKHDENATSDTLSRAKGGGFEKLAAFGANLAVGLTDPIGDATMLIPAVGEERAAALTARASGLIGRTAVRAGVGAVRGVVAQTALEPLIYAGKKYEQADYSLNDSFNNILFGGVLGAGLHVIPGSIAEAYRNYKGRAHPWEPASVSKETAPDIGEEITLPSSLPNEHGITSDINRDTGEFTVKSDHGESVAQQYGDTLKMRDTATDVEHQGNGEGTARLEHMIELAHSEGLKYESDIGVSEGAAKLYERLSERGYDVKLNPHTVDASGYLHSDTGGPVFEVRPTGTDALKTAPTAENVVSSAPDNIRRKALQGALGQALNDKPLNVEPFYAGERGKTQSGLDTWNLRKNRFDPESVRNSIPEMMGAVEERRTQAAATPMDFAHLTDIQKSVVKFARNEPLSIEDHENVRKAATIQAINERAPVPTDALRDLPQSIVKDGIDAKQAAIAQSAIDAAEKEKDDIAPPPEPPEKFDTTPEKADEDLQLANAELEANSKRLGLPATDAALDVARAVSERTKTWAQAAELAVNCLLRGG